MRAEVDLRAAVAAGVLSASRGRAPLLQSIADVARAIFGARASSIMLFDEARAELVFEAVWRGRGAARPADPEGHRHCRLGAGGATRSS